MKWALAFGDCWILAEDAVPLITVNYQRIVSLCEPTIRVEPLKLGTAGSLVDPHNLRALQAEACHQAALVEGERIDTAMQCVGSETTGHAFVHKNDTGTG